MSERLNLSRPAVLRCRATRGRFPDRIDHAQIAERATLHGDFPQNASQSQNCGAYCMRPRNRPRGVAGIVSERVRKPVRHAAVMGRPRMRFVRPDGRRRVRSLARRVRGSRAAAGVAFPRHGDGKPRALGQHPCDPAAFRGGLFGCLLHLCLRRARSIGRRAIVPDGKQRRKRWRAHGRPGVRR